MANINVVSSSCSGVQDSSENPISTRGVKRVSDVNNSPSSGKVRRLAHSLYHQEVLNIRKVTQREETVSTYLETVHEDRDTPGNHKRCRITVFDNPSDPSKHKLKCRRARARILRKQGVKVPRGFMFNIQDVISSLAHIDNDYM